MGDEGDSGGHAGFLPPEPSGPEPDLGTGPGDIAPEPPAPRHLGFAPPAGHDTHAPPPEASPPPQQQPGWSAPHQSGGQPGQPQQWGYPGQQAVPDNGAAVAGLSLSITAGTLLLLSVGISSIISIVCAVLGIRYSRLGRERVDRGETPKHRGVAQAGFVIGIVALVLSILGTLLWLLVAVLYATDENFRQDLEDELDGGDSDPPRGFQTSLQLGAMAIRSLASLLR